MKYAKKVAKLQGRIGWWNAQSKEYQAAHKCPGSTKLR